MRPKVVILILVVAFGALGIIAVFKGMTGKNPATVDNPPVSPTTQATSSDTNANNSQVTVAGSNGVPQVSPELHAALVEKETDQIRELQNEIDGTNNAVIIAALLEKFSSPEREVRAAVLQSLREINDTNAVPGLQKAADNMQDAHEKVTILDAIDYIKLPSATADLPPETATNYALLNTNNWASRTNHFVRNPRFNHGAQPGNTNPGNNLPPAGQPNPPAGQPQ